VDLKCWSQIRSSEQDFFSNHDTTLINTIWSKKLNSTGPKQKTTVIQRELNQTLRSDGEDCGSVKLTDMDEVSDYQVVAEVCYTVLISTIL